MVQPTLTPNQDRIYVANIKVIGIGGAGNNAVNRMLEENINGVEFWIANTDAQVLLNSPIKNKIFLGRNTTKGLGAGANPEIGRLAAEESIEEIRAVLNGADMVFIAAGEGGGTGTGAAPVVARVAKELGALTIGIVTRPFIFEGKMRNAYAASGIEELKPNVDSLIIVSNDKLMQMYGNIPFRDSFKESDNVLCHSVKTITDLIVRPALINRDFADVRTVMANKGTALIGIGIGHGETKVQDSATRAVFSPLLETAITGARNAIVFITGGSKMTINDANDAVGIVREEAGGKDINIIFGVALDENLGDEMIVTVVATDFQDNNSSMVGSPSRIETPKIDNLRAETVTKVNPVELQPVKQVNEPVKAVEIPAPEVKTERDFVPAFLRRRK